MPCLCAVSWMKDDRALKAHNNNLNSKYTHLPLHEQITESFHSSVWTMFCNDVRHWCPLERFSWVMNDSNVLYAAVFKNTVMCQNIWFTGIILYMRVSSVLLCLIHACECRHSCMLVHIFSKVNHDSVKSPERTWLRHYSSLLWIYCPP